MIPTYLRIGLQVGPSAILQLARAVSPSRYDEAVDPNRFTFRESIAHISDWANVDRDRLNAALTSPDSLMPDLDEGEFAVRNRYHETDPVEQAQRLLANRQELLELVDTLSAPQLELAYVHSKRGRTTVLEHLITMLGHEAYHIEHLTRYLR